MCTYKEKLEEDFEHFGVSLKKCETRLRGERGKSTEFSQRVEKAPDSAEKHLKRGGNPNNRQKQRK